MALSVVDRILRTCHEVERAHTQGICGEREIRSIDNCLRNLERIAHFLSPATHDELSNSLVQLKATMSTRAQRAGNVAFSADRLTSGESLHVKYKNGLYMMT